MRENCSGGGGHKGVRSSSSALRELLKRRVPGTGEEIREGLAMGCYPVSVGRGGGSPWGPRWEAGGVGGGNMSLFSFLTFFTIWLGHLGVSVFVKSNRGARGWISVKLG